MDLSPFQSLVVLLVLNWLDSGNAMLASLPAYQYRRLQSVLNPAARLIYRCWRFDHVTPLLRDLHWLKVPERVTYKLAVTVYRCLHGMALPYLCDDLQRIGAGCVPATGLVTFGDRLQQLCLFFLFWLKIILIFCFFPCMTCVCSTLALFSAFAVCI